MERVSIDFIRNSAADENGTAIISALLILMLLTFVALLATHTTVDEKMMVRSEAIFEQVFDLAESANFEGVQALADSSPECSLEATATAACKTKEFLVNANVEGEDNDILNLDKNLDGKVSGADFTGLTRSGLDATNNTYKKIYQKKIEGSSLGLETSRLYTYNVFGFSEKYNSSLLIKTGFKKRF